MSGRGVGWGLVEAEAGDFGGLDDGEVGVVLIGEGDGEVLDAAGRAYVHQGGLCRVPSGI